MQGLEKYYGQDIFITEALTREAITEMEKSVKMDKPFYLYMSHYAVHTPYDEINVSVRNIADVTMNSSRLD